MVYDPDDKRLFVPKRLGFGSTLNFAHPGSWVIMGVCLVALIVKLVRG